MPLPLPPLPPLPLQFRDKKERNVGVVSDELDLQRSQRLVSRAVHLVQLPTV